MALILALETSGNQFSVVLASDGKLVSEIEIREEKAQERLLATVIHDVLRQTGKKPEDLDAVAAGSGPGSYTGLRIGMALASGFCLAAGLPLIAVGTLDNICFQLFSQFPEAAAAIPVVQARKDEYFAGIWLRGRDENPLVHPACFHADELPALLERLGTGASVASSCEDPEMRQSLFASHQVQFAHIQPTAATVASIAFRRLSTPEVSEQQAANEPSYLKPVYISTKR